MKLADIISKEKEPENFHLQDVTNVLHYSCDKNDNILDWVLCDNEFEKLPRIDFPNCSYWSGVYIYGGDCVKENSGEAHHIALSKLP